MAEPININFPNGIVWKITDCRAVVPVKAVSGYTYQDPENMDLPVFATTKNGNIFGVFRSQAAAVKEAMNLIDNSEHNAKLQLINAKRYRLHLEKSIKDYQK